MKIALHLTSLAFVVSLSCFAVSSGFAQPQPVPAPSPGVPMTDHSPQALITFDDQNVVHIRSGEGRFPRVAARINQAATILLQYPTELGGQRIIVESLDGAQVIGDIQNLILGMDGTAILNVRIGGSEGLYRFALLCGDSHTLLRFYASAP